MTTAIITENTAAQNAIGTVYAGVVDANLAENYPDSNLSAVASIDVLMYSTVREWALLKASGLSNIPANAVVSSASLFLRQISSGNAYDISIRQMLQSWDISTVTWANYNGTNAWGSSGAGGAADRVSTPEDTVTIASTINAWYAFDVTALTQNIVDGTISNEGVHLEVNPAAANSSWKSFDSSDAADGLRPEWVVVYTVPNLASDDASSTPFADAVSVNQSHTLTGSDASGTGNNESAGVSQNQQLSGVDASEAGTIDNGNISQTHTLSASDAEATATADTGAITPSVTIDLIVTDATSTPSIDGAPITQAQILTGTDADSSPESEISVVNQEQNLSGVDASETSTADTGSVAQQHQLQAEDAQATPSAESVALTGEGIGKITNPSVVSLTAIRTIKTLKNTRCIKQLAA